MIDVGKSFKGWKKHNIGSEESPDQNEKQGDEEKINLVVSLFHNTGFI
jgi:hypothetical protein